MEKPSHHEICHFDEGAEVNVNLYVTSKAPVIPFGAKEKSLEKVLNVCFQTKFESKHFIRSGYDKTAFCP